MKKGITLFLLSLLFITPGCKQSKETIVNEYNIVPLPNQMIPQQGRFEISKKVRVITTACTPDVQIIADSLINRLKLTSGITIKQTFENITDEPVIRFVPQDGMPEEGYKLSVTPQNITLTASTPKGFFYAVQTLYQLLPPVVYGNQKVKNAEWSVPAVEIEDAPRFAYRGLMLDVCRHFSPVEYIYKFIDMLAMHKMNTFHWHLTDDQGWRIEIRHYPELTKVGSRRAETVLGRNTNIYDGIPSGGYYTQRQIRDVVAYAAERFITVIPEIEMPGHASAALAAYPWLGCAGEGYIVRTRWGVFPEVYCAGKDSTFEFMENVLAEVCELFPSEYIHIGGDECPKQSWTSCPACQQRIRNERLEHENELQSYFVHRIEKWLNARGRNLIGWDEILEGGISKTATIMSWRGADGGVAAAKAGNQVIMTPNTHCYLDYFQTQEPERLEPLGIGGYVPVRKVYSFDPYDRLSSAEQSCIQGVQGNIWTEYIASFAHAQHMALPRLAALAEVGWACDRRDFGDFTRRMTVFRKLYDKCGYRYASYFFEGTGE